LRLQKKAEANNASSDEGGKATCIRPGKLAIEAIPSNADLVPIVNPG